MYGMLPGIFTPLLVLTIYYVLAFIFIKDLECAFIAQVCITRNLLFWPLPYHARLKTFLTSSCHSHEKRYQALSHFSILHVSWAKYWRENPPLSDPSYFNYAPIKCIPHSPPSWAKVGQTRGLDIMNWWTCATFCELTHRGLVTPPAVAMTLHVTPQK